MPKNQLVSLQNKLQSYLFGGISPDCFLISPHFEPSLFLMDTTSLPRFFWVEVVDWGECIFTTSTFNLALKGRLALKIPHFLMKGGACQGRHASLYESKHSYQLSSPPIPTLSIYKS